MCKNAIERPARNHVNISEQFISPDREKLLPDFLFLTGIVLLSCILYIKSLGFYGLDWVGLRDLSLANDQSFSGLFEILYKDHLKMQPGKVLYHVGLYKLFGLGPLGYHIFNHAVFLLNILLFYVILRKSNGNRLLCISAALVYAFLPHYSSVRFWLQGFEFNLALTFYFLSLYSDFTGLRTGSTGFWGWRLSSAMSLICSTLINPIALALFFLNPILIWHQTRRMPDKKVERREEKKPNSFTEQIRNNPRVLFYLQLALVLPLVNLNILTAIDTGTSNFPHIFRHIFDANYGHYDWGLNYIHAVGVAYGSFGLGLPLVVWLTIMNHANIITFVAAGLLGLVIYLFISSTIKRFETGYIGKSDLLRFMKYGFIVFAMGYTAYLIDVRVRFSSAGAVNIAAVAAALGVALTVIAFLGWVSNLFRSKQVRAQSFCLLIALFCSAGFLVNNHIAWFWLAANEQRQEILDDVRSTLPTLSPGSTVIVDGICPYIGPAPVFESNWDLEGALKLLYQDNSIRANIVTADIDINDDRIRVSGAGVQNYPFKNVSIYNHKEKRVYPLASAQDARQYFEMINPSYKVNCKDGRLGFGEPIFKIKSFVIR